MNAASRPWYRVGQIAARTVDGYPTTGIAIAQQGVARAVALVYAGFGDGIETADFIVRACNHYDAMLAGLKEWAGECGECNGSGLSVTLTAQGEYGPDADCDQCADIRALIKKVEDQS